MRKRLSAFLASLFLSLSSLFVLVPGVAHAAVITWDGEGTDNNFSTAENWVGDVAPVNGDSISLGLDVIYDTCSADVTLNNDLDPGTVTLAGITMTGSLPEACYRNIIIEGNDINLSGNVTASDDEEFAYIYFEVDTVTATVPLILENSRLNSLNIGSNNVTLSVSGAESVVGSGDLLLTGGLGGAGGCAAYETSTDDNSGFTGDLTIEEFASTRVDANENVLARSAASVTLNSGGLIPFRTEFGQDIDFDTPLTFSGGSMNAFQGYADDSCTDPTENVTLTISSDVTFTEETSIYLFKVNLVFTGEVTGEEHIDLYQTSSGTITIGDSVTAPEKFTTEYTANSPSTNVYVQNNEIAVVTGTYGFTNVNSGGILKGTGTVGELNVNAGGTVAPGMSPGILNSGDLTFVSGSTYEFEVGGAGNGEYDQINVTGTVDLGNGTLEVIRFNDFKPAGGQAYTIINNDGSDAVEGTFLNLAEGATFTVDGYVFKISYVGGDGNDVVLTVQSVPATPNTGFSLLTANPIVTLLITTTLAGAILVLARRYSTEFVKR